jgi:hypothetical protein
MKYIVYWIIATWACTFNPQRDSYGFPKEDLEIWSIKPLDTLSRTFTSKDSAHLFIAGSKIHRDKLFTVNFIDTIWMDSTVTLKNEVK